MSLAAWFLLAFMPQDEPELFGQEPSTVVAMGREAWSTYFCEKSGGGSTAALSNAEHSYGFALTKVNDRTLANADPKTRRLCDWVRINLEPFGDSAVDLARTLAGGGTMYNIFYAAQKANVEEAVADILSGKTKVSASSQAEVRKALAEAKKVLESERTNLAEMDKTMNLSKDSYQECLVHLDSMGRSVNAAAAFLPPYPAHMRNRIWSLYLNGFGATLDMRDGG